MSQRNYDRLTTLTLEEGFRLITSGKEEVIIQGNRVGCSSLRLNTFLFKGIQCSIKGCQAKGTYFAVERTPVKPGKKIHEFNRYHMNLWGVNEHGDEVLFTHDHSIARSLGGKDKIWNTETMCFKHNMKKSKLESRVNEDFKKSQVCGKKCLVCVHHCSRLVLAASA